jgi:phosphoribosyl 1,2-cyclic phosphodiesterase
MFITFYGVRGSIPSPGPATAGYGGNTSCVHVQLVDGRHFIFDAGTGIRLLGKRLSEVSDPLTVLLTHSHWDHIQGFPFFAPAFERDREIVVCQSLPREDSVHVGALQQMNGHNFPLDLTHVPSRVRYVNEPTKYFRDADLHIERKALNHPGGGFAYKLQEDGVTFAYVTDNELEPPERPATTYDQWVEFVRGADVLIHDSQYRETDAPYRHGWGHSLISQVRQLAYDADVRCLVLYHHDPDRSDAELEEVRLESETFFRSRKHPTVTVVAFEGLVLEALGQKSGDAVVEVRGNPPKVKAPRKSSRKSS